MNSLRSFTLGALCGTTLSLSLVYFKLLKQPSSAIAQLTQAVSQCEDQISSLATLTRQTQARECALAAIQDLVPTAAEFHQSKLALQADLKALVLETRQLRTKIERMQGSAE